MNKKPLYQITRRFFNNNVASEVMAQCLTLSEAREWCRNPETSSRTCTKPELLQMTLEFGPWFDGFEEM